MVKVKLFLLFLLILKTFQLTNSLLLSELYNTKYQCNSAGCSGSNIISVSNIRNCQKACLTNPQCRTVTFDTNTHQCEIFIDIPSQYGSLIAQTNVITMIAVDERQLSARK